MFFKSLKNLFWKNGKQVISHKRGLAKYVIPNNSILKLKNINLCLNLTSGKRFLSKDKNVETPQSSSKNSKNSNGQETPIRKLLRLIYCLF